MGCTQHRQRLLLGNSGKLCSLYNTSHLLLQHLSLPQVGGRGLFRGWGILWRFNNVQFFLQGLLGTVLQA